MVNIGDTVHVYNEEFGADYQAVVLDVFDDGTSQVQHYMHLTPRLRRRKMGQAKRANNAMHPPKQAGRFGLASIVENITGNLARIVQGVHRPSSAGDRAPSWADSPERK